MAVHSIGRIQQLWRYPIKSMAGEPLERAALDETGIVGDRSWALRDVLADELTDCKAIPALLSCAARYPGEPQAGLEQSHAIIVLPDGRTVRTDDPFAAAAVSAIAGRPLSLWPLQPASHTEHYRLRRPKSLAAIRHRMGLPPDEPLPDFSVYDPEMMAELQQYATPRGSYKDAYPIHFVTSASLHSLRGFAPGIDIDARRFRPNLLIETDLETGFPEHDWAGFELIIGGVVLHCGPRAVRCSMPGQPQQGLSGEPRIGAVLRRHTGFNMGALATVARAGVIAIGDEVFLETREQQRPTRPAALPQAQVSVDPSVETPASGLGVFRRLRVVTKEREALEVVSLGLKADPALRLAFVPGQHLTIRLQRPGDAAPLLRSYSISSAPRSGAPVDYRITVKRMGAASSYLHDDVRVGDELEVRWPTGRFFVLPASATPLVLISNGIGVTPLFAMLQSVAEQAPGREVFWVHATINGRTHVFRRQLEALAAVLPGFSAFTVYRRPDDTDVPGRDYQATRRLELEDLAPIARMRDAEVFLCGTASFMSSVSALLQHHGVRPEQIRTESFGASSARTANADLAVGRTTVRQVRFARSGIATEWAASQGTLLELAEELGIPVDYGCRFGDCCACAVPLLEGKVAYAEAGIAAEPGMVLLCCAEASSDLVLDL